MSITSVNPHNNPGRKVVISVLQIRKQIKLRGEMTGPNISATDLDLRFLTEMLSQILLI